MIVSPSLVMKHLGSKHQAWWLENFSDLNLLFVCIDSLINLLIVLWKFISCGETRPYNTHSGSWWIEWYSVNQLHQTCRDTICVNERTCSAHVPHSPNHADLLSIRSTKMCGRSSKYDPKRVFYLTPTPQTTKRINRQNTEDLSRHLDGRIVLYISCYRRSADTKIRAQANHSRAMTSDRRDSKARTRKTGSTKGNA